MKRNAGYCLGLDEDNSLVLKLGRGGDKAYHLEWIKYFSPGSRELCHQIQNISRLRNRVVQSLPNEEVSLMTVMLPGMKDRMRYAALQGMVVKEKGGQGGDWVIDIKTVQKRRRDGGPVSRNRSTVVFAEKALVEEHYRSAQKMGCYPAGMLPGFLAFDRLYRIHNPELAGKGGWILVFIGNKDRFLCAGDPDGPLFYRMLPEDLSKGTEEEEYLEKIVVEIERSNYFAQQTESKMDLGKIILSGEPNVIERLAGKLAGRLELEIHRWNLEDLFSTDDPNLLWEEMMKLAVAAVSLHGLGYNLLPPEAHVGSRSRIRRSAAVTLASLGIASAPILLAGGLWTSSIQNEYLDSAADRLDRLQACAGNGVEAYLHNQAMTACRANIEGIATGLNGSARVLREIALRTPGNVTFDGIDLLRGDDDSLRLVLRGRSVAGSGEEAQGAFLGFLRSLEGVPDLIETREPLYLEISGIEEDDKSEYSRVVFTIEYFIVEGR